MSISRQYKPLLLNKFAQLESQGYAILERWELQLWFSKERITNAVWREISDEWEEDGYEGSWDIVFCGEGSASDRYVFIKTNKIKKLKNLTK